MLVYSWISVFRIYVMIICFFFFFQAEDGIRDLTVTGVQTCALPIYPIISESQVDVATGYANEYTKSRKQKHGYPSEIWPEVAFSHQIQIQKRENQYWHGQAVKTVPEDKIQNCAVRNQPEQGIRREWNQVCDIPAYNR